MKVICQFQNMDHSSYLEDLINERFQKIGRLNIAHLKIHVTLKMDGKKRRVDAHLNAYSVTILASSVDESNFVSSIDGVLAKLTRQIKKVKDKIQNHNAQEHGFTEKIDMEIEEQKVG